MHADGHVLLDGRLRGVLENGVGRGARERRAVLEPRGLEPQLGTGLERAVLLQGEILV